MGEVWRGEWPDDGTPVAVKLLRTSASEDARAAFDHEVRAIAALHHPHVVVVLDYGRVSAEETARGVPVPAGSPYLVMELLDGTLAEWRGHAAWPQLRPALLAILDGLAHVHARGVVHRDVKPANVLLGGRLQPGAIKLSDFGIAHLRTGGGGADDASVGTPSYMPPEQLQGRWRDLGPWTDLYALGCLVYDLVHGAPPFGRLDLLRAAAIPVRRKAPRLTGVPAAFAAWVAKAVEREPEERWSSAAEAARALVDIEDGADRPRRRRPAAADEPTRLHVEPELATLALAAPPGSGRAVADAAGGLPVPPDWSRPEPPFPPRLVGAGLGLLGLREPRLVGRRREQDAAWASLREVARDRRARLVLLRGAAGVGKTRLSAWLGERAAEVGAATVLEARLGEADALRGTAARWLATAGLDGEPLRERLRVHGLDDLDAWAGWLAGADLPRARIHGLLRALFRHAARRRVAIVRLDDAHRDPAALRLCGEVLADASPSGVLLVATVVTEDCGPELRATLETLADRDRVRVVDVDPLGEADHRALVRSLLPLAAETAVEVEARTAGSPAFALGVLADWASRGLLVPGPAGFELAARTTALPADLAAWSAERLAAAFEGRTGAEVTAIRAAAVLGVHVEDDVWDAVCARLGVERARALVEAWTRAGRVRRLERGRWSFADARMREALALSAPEAERIALHGACADVLADRPGWDAVERRGVHLLAAGRADEALEPLRMGARYRSTTAGLGASIPLLLLHDEALDRLGAPADDPRRCETLFARARMASSEGANEVASALVGRAERIARRHGEKHTLGRALYEQATIGTGTGDPQVGVLLDQAEALFEETGIALSVAFVLELRSRWALANGDRKTAREAAARALQLFEAGRLPAGIMLAHERLAASFLVAGELGLAERHGLEALALARSIDNPSDQANALDLLAEVAHRRGELDLALARADEAIALEQADGGTAAAERLTRCDVLVASGRFDEARPELVRLVAYGARSGRPSFVRQASALLVACLADGHDVRALDVELERLDTFGPRDDARVARALGVAAERLRTSGDSVRARRLTVTTR